MLLALLLMLAAANPLLAVPLKVVSINHRNGRVVLLMPVHQTRIEAVLVPEEPEIRLRVNEFYDAEFESGQVDTVKRNVLTVTVPGEKPVRFHLRKITFLWD
jgi:hypothetical protein